MRIRLKSLAYGGACVGEVLDEEHQGKVAFVRHGIPGEVVTATVKKAQPRFIEADLISVEEASTHRAVPPCPKFGICGGCDLQHIASAFQREEKRRMVETTLTIQGKLNLVEPVTLLGIDLPAWNYRKRITLHVGLDGSLGFYRSGSGEVVDLDYCFLATESINMVLVKLRTLAQKWAKWMGAMVLEEHSNEIYVLAKMRENMALDDSLLAQINAALSRVVPHYSVKQGERLLCDTAHGINIGHFSQVNEEANALLIQTILDSISNTEVTELFAGAGNFSLALAQAGKIVEAIEVDAALVSQGQAQAQDLGLALTFVESSAERYVKSNKLRASVLLDPPRGGAMHCIQAWDATNIQQVVYVSCNLPTLTRDLKLLVTQGFGIQHIFALDMFPQTHHIETVTVLGKGAIPTKSRD